MKRRVGAGLSVERLAASRKSTYDPRIARQKRDALAAGRVNKYRKLRARVLGDSGKHREREEEDQEEVRSGRGQERRRRLLFSLFLFVLVRRVGGVKALLVASNGSDVSFRFLCSPMAPRAATKIANRGAGRRAPRVLDAARRAARVAAPGAAAVASLTPRRRVVL